MERDDFEKAFLKLALEIDRSVPGYLDAYYGPPDIQSQVASLQPPRWEDLRGEQQVLLDALPGEDPQRRKYLAALLESMGFLIRKGLGESFSYLEEVQGLFGIEPTLAAEEDLLAEQAKLDGILPGKGSLADRAVKRAQELRIPPELIPQAVESILAVIRPQVDKLFSLVPGEDFTIDYVHDKPWGAYNYYQGNYQSKIEINLDRDWTPSQLLFLLCHEAYPGHHTEMQIKERQLYQGKGYLEESCLIIFSPRTVLGEGIADTGLEVIFEGMEIYRWLSDQLYPDLGLPPVTPEELWQGRKIAQTLKLANTNAGILYHQGELDAEQALDYMMTYQLISRKEAKGIFRFIEDPFWSTYLPTYTVGYSLIDQAAGGGSKRALFQRLLAEQLVPADLSPS